MPHYNIIARKNGVGLDRDVSLIKDVLLSAGHEVTVSHRKEKNWLHKTFQKSVEYDVNIFIERVFPAWVPFAKKNYLIPNQERFPYRHIKHLEHIDRVLAKSRHAEEIFNSLGCETSYISFTSEDVNLPEIAADYSRVLHLAGKSTMKGTDKILSLWGKHPEWPELTLIQCPENAPNAVPPNVKLISEYLPAEDIRRLLNEHGIHLCPSTSEGWGHYIAEALACEAVVLTTDAPPMNELVTPERGIMIPYKMKAPRHLGTNFYADGHALEEAITDSIAMPAEEKKALGSHARKWFLENDAAFKERLRKVL